MRILVNMTNTAQDKTTDLEITARNLARGVAKIARAERARFAAHVAEYKIREAQIVIERLYRIARAERDYAKCLRAELDLVDALTSRSTPAQVAAAQRASDRTNAAIREMNAVRAA